jgi:hypothetical protein
MSEIVLINGGGGNGNPGDSFFMRGTGFTPAATIAANSTTVGGGATGHAAIVVDSNGEFGPVYVTITSAITTAGFYNIIVTTNGGAATFASYWEVIEGCGFNDIYRRGDIDKNEAKPDVMREYIPEALAEFEGEMKGFLDDSDFPFTVGAYPKVAVGLIADLAVALFYERRGMSKDYIDKANSIRKEVMTKLDRIKTRKLRLKFPDGTWCGVIPHYSVKNTNTNDFHNVTEVNEDDYEEE